MNSNTVIVTGNTHEYGRTLILEKLYAKVIAGEIDEIDAVIELLPHYKHLVMDVIYINKEKQEWFTPMGALVYKDLLSTVYNSTVVNYGKYNFVGDDANCNIAYKDLNIDIKTTNCGLTTIAPDNSVANSLPTILAKLGLTQAILMCLVYNRHIDND